MKVRKTLVQQFQVNFLILIYKRARLKMIRCKSINHLRSLRSNRILLKIIVIRRTLILVKIFIKKFIIAITKILTIMGILLLVVIKDKQKRVIIVLNL
jgi:hypothetical protein